MALYSLRTNTLPDSNLCSACSIGATACRGYRPFSTEKEPLTLSPGVPNPVRSLVSHEITSDEISAFRTYVPFAQWSLNPLGAGFALPFALTNSSRFSFADSPLGCRFSRLPLRSWGPVVTGSIYSTNAKGPSLSEGPSRWWD